MDITVKTPEGVYDYHEVQIDVRFYWRHPIPPLFLKALAKKMDAVIKPLQNDVTPEVRYNGEVASLLFRINKVTLRQLKMIGERFASEFQAMLNEIQKIVAIKDALDYRERE